MHIVSKNLKVVVFTLLTLIASSSSFAYKNNSEVRKQLEPNGYIYGLGVGLSNEIYKGFDTRVIPIPVLGYKGERLSVYGPFVSYDLLSFDDIDIAVKAAPRFQGFDSSDSYIFSGMKKRHFSMDAGFSVNYEQSDWRLGFSAMFDAFNRSNGTELSSSISKALKYGPLFIEPSVSVSYLDANHVDYYYGVDISEVNEKRVEYSGSSALNYDVGISFATPIFFGGFSRLAITHTWFDSAISDSPLVDRDKNVSANFIFTKFF